MRSTIILALILTTIATTSAFTISCTYRSVFYWTGTEYTCETTINGPPSDKQITANTGTHSSGMSNANVVAIDIQGSFTLTFVPRGITRVFPNVVSVKIKKSAIETLYGDELNEIPKLRLFEVYNSNLKTISSRLFEKTPNVNFISFAYGKLSQVGRDLFKPLDPSRIGSIYLNSNWCIDQEAFEPETVVEIIEWVKVLCTYNDEVL
jgi:hypothetical protein